MNAEQKATLRKLSRDRLALKRSLQKIDRLDVDIASEDTDQRKIPDLKAELAVEHRVAEGIRASIEEAERSIYGDWAPKRPPSPDRSLEIRRRNDEVYGA